MNLKQAGKRVLLLTLLIVILLNFLPINYTIRLFIGSFGFGSGFVLMIVGKNDKYQL